MEKPALQSLCTKRKNSFLFLYQVLTLPDFSILVKQYLFFILFLIGISYSSQSQGRIDSLRKANKERRALLRKNIDSLQNVLNSLRRRENIWKELEAPPWTGEGKFTFLLNQSSYSNWISGGENAVAANIVVNYDFNYKKRKWKWDNKIISSFGASYLDEQGYRKTDDRFEYNSVLAYNATKKWYVSFFSNFITQFTRGFDYSQEPKELVSSGLSPAYWSFGPGMFWRKNDNYRINLAPATSRITFVSDAFSGQYGVPLGKNSVYGLGFNLSSYLRYQIVDNVTMENIIQIYSDYLNKPQNVDINYQANFTFVVSKLLTMNLTLHMIVDDNATERSTFQFRQLFGLGFNYTFHKI